MAGPTDIASILSQTGRIEKINQNSFVHSEVNKQILTEQEARERLRSARQISEGKRVQEAADRKQKKEKQQARDGKTETSDEIEEQSTEADELKKHIIDVVI
jgi:hypothetical protein